MPLVIYLDTQDYIKIFNEPKGGSNHRVLDQLLECRDNGDILIGFSFATVMEFITKPIEKYRAERVRRGELIKHICGANAFPNVIDLARGAKFPNGGRWMFRANEKLVSAQAFKKKMHDTLVEELAKNESLNRRQRRELGRKSTMSQLIRRTGTALGRSRSDYGDLPVSDEFIESRIFERFIKGQCSNAEFEERMHQWISDPAEYSRILYDYADHPDAIAKFFGKPIDEIEGAISELKKVEISMRSVKEDMLKLRKKLIESGYSKREARDMIKLQNFSATDLSQIDKSLGEVVGKGRSGHFRHYLERIIKTDVKFKRSDVMDLMQMCYAYECDLFRCDKAMADTFRDFQPFQGKLVSRFSELPERIERKLSAESC